MAEWICFGKDGNQIHPGDEVSTFREEKVSVVHLYPPGTSAGGMFGKCTVKDAKGHEHYFNISVIRGTFRQVEEQHGDLGGEEIPGTRSYRRMMAREKGYDE